MKKKSLSESGFERNTKRTSKREVLNVQQWFNRSATVRRRTAVEHPFRVIQRHFKHVKVGYRGPIKNTVQLHPLFALSNLWMARRMLLQEFSA